MESPGRPYLRLRKGRPEEDGRPAVKRRRQPASKNEEGIRCRACGQVVTGGEQRMAVGGAHRHTFFNPAGIVYEVGCFRQAAGCIASGPPSAEFTWFAGHLWRIALCRRCRTHLGWHFTAGDESFFGLILPRLAP